MIKEELVEAQRDKAAAEELLEQEMAANLEKAEELQAMLSKVHFA